MTQAFLATSLWGNPATYAAIGTTVSVLFLGIRYLVKVGRWTGEFDADRKNIGAVLNGIQKNLSEIGSDIKRIFRQLPPKTIQEGSPLHLTELGERIAGELDATTWAHETAQEIRDQIESGDPYDIQEYCFAFVHNELELSSDFRAKVHRSAYDSGIQRSKVLDVLAVVLRDELLPIVEPSSGVSLR